MDLSERRKIREAYMKYGPILEKGTRLSPYGIGINWNFSPIEMNVWSSIRILGLPLYPQVPVLNYFLDFGDLENRIGIEVDSIKWHKDKEKDRIRQDEIEKVGWRVFRIQSRMVYKDRCEYNDPDGYFIKEKEQEFYSECAEGILMKAYENIDYRKIYCWMQK